MVAYFSPIVKIVSNALMYKNGSLIVTSVLFSSASKILNIEILGKPISLLILISLLFIADFITGVMASRYESKISTDPLVIEDKKFKSSKITFTFFKFIMLFMWIWLEDSVNSKVSEIPSLCYIYELLRVVPLILISLREYVSIGENIERRYGKKPYMFNLAEKIFEILEFKFIKKIKSND